MLQAHIKNIWVKNNHNKKLLLKTIDFELVGGKVYTILGKNGSGKSTLIKSLTGLLNNNIFITEGHVVFDNQDILSCNIVELRKVRLNKIRYVFQDAANSFDPLKTIKYYFDNSSSTQKDVDDLLNYFLLPGYSHISTLYPYELSGGMAQRLGFVMTFLAWPQLIILDEPTSGIDYTITNLLLLRLREYVAKENGTVLIVTHDINFAEKVSDELAFLSDGTITKFRVKKIFFTEKESEKLKIFMSAYAEVK